MGNKRSVAQQYTMEIFKLTPLSACVRLAIAGGVMMGSLAPVHAQLPVARDVWVSQGYATNETIGNTLRVNQETDKVILNWKSFNVGAENEVQFHQPGSTSIALNRIFQNDPSQILGKVTANGQIYLYNNNGFVFGKDSVVDVNTLVATSLNISNEAFEKGIVNLYTQTGKAAFEGKNGDPKNAAISVEAGAQVHIGKNGRLIMAAPQVTNKGAIDAGEQGQILLVASKDKVYLQVNPSKDNKFNGLLVEVGKGGEVSNFGSILARQGNVTLMGFAVNQGGRISATTSSNINGSIRLLAEEGIQQVQDLSPGTTVRSKDLNDGLGKEAKVTFEAGSLTEIVADANGGSAIDEQIQPKSYLEARGHTIHMQSGSSIVAPSGNVNFKATDEPNSEITGGNQGRIILDKGSLIDVSGIKDAKASIERNVVDVPVQTFELRDSPLQKGGVLQGATVKVDIRDNTEIIDVGGRDARIEKSLEERLGTGGTINLQSSGDVIVNNEAVVDISGGSVKFEDGYIHTTKLLTDYGKLVDISDADPNEHYISIFGVVKEVHEKWGITQIWDTSAQFSKGRFEQGYVQGLDAGKLIINAPKLSWDGDLIAGSVSSINQRTGETIAFGGSFAFDSTKFDSTRTFSQNVVIQTEKNQTDIGVNKPFPKQESDGKNPRDLVFTTAITNDSGIQEFSVSTLGNVKLDKNANVSMKPYSKLNLNGSSIDVQGDVYSASGEINLTNIDNRNNKSFGITVSSESILNVSGRWINDYAQGLNANVTPTEALAIDGGKIKLDALSLLDLQDGAQVTADGGAWLAVNGHLTEGKGGDISLLVNKLGSLDTELKLNLQEVTLSASALSEGGSLTLGSGEIVVTKDKDYGVSDSKAFVIGTNIDFDKHVEKSDFDKLAGFSKIDLRSTTGDLTIKADTEIALIQKNQVLQHDFSQQASGQATPILPGLAVLPEHLRSPVDLSLSSLKQNVILETGSKVEGDTNASFDINATLGGIYIDGLVSAPAGSIDLNIIADGNAEINPAQSIWLGKHGSLLAKGSTRMNPLDSLGLITGDVLDGGNITFNARRGYVVLEEGSTVDVSGTSAVLDLPVNSAGIRFVPTEIGSSAGKIALSAAEGAVLDGILKGTAGSATTRSGRIDLALDRSHRQDSNPLFVYPEGDLFINVLQDENKTLDGNTKFGDNFADSFVGKMTVSASKLMAAGFDDVRFKVRNVGAYVEEVKFLGDVNLTTRARIDLDAPRITWSGLEGSAQGVVNLDTAFLRLGKTESSTQDNRTESGEGIFTAHAQWTQLEGASLWNGFKQINLNSEHDLRTVGVLLGTVGSKEFFGNMVTSADLNLVASQIYPSTLTQFIFAVKNNPEGKITLSGNANTTSTPLSAAGKLSFDAPIIEQNGVLKAPFGTINLNAGTQLTLGENSLTSVSGEGAIIPLGLLQGGFDWLYPINVNNTNAAIAQTNIVFDKPPEKNINLSAPSLALKEGSVVDLSGGGDLQAYEFLPGLGGSKDILDSKTSFAVLPTLGSEIAPYDHLQNIGFDYEIGSKVYLSGTEELPAGEYAVLPTHYALLPGAFLVTPQANTQDLTQTVNNTAGLPIVSGYHVLAGTGTRDARTSGFLIENGAELRTHSQFDVQTANAFYTARALQKQISTPFLPMDSGQISVVAQEKLDLQGQFKVASPGGRGARMDIAANRINVVKSLSAAPAAGTLEILADDLNNLGVDSLLLGGGRSRNDATGATDLAVTSEQVTFDGDVHLSLTDLVAAATSKVEVKSGAALNASGSVKTGDTQFNVNGDGALLRVSADNQIILNRTGTSDTANSGELVVQEGATLTASKSILADATKSTSLAGDIKMDGGSLNLAANAINIGEVSGASDGILNLSNEKLKNLTVDELVLSSRDTINFVGNVGLFDNNGNFNALKFDKLVINAAGFSGFGGLGKTAKIEANTLQLQNTLEKTASQAATGQGDLYLTAQNYTQGSGKFGINGFSNVNVTATEGFKVDQGVKKDIATELNVGGDLNLLAGYLTASSGSELKIDGSGHHIQVDSNFSTPIPTSLGLGGAINLVADKVDFNARVLMPSGSLGLRSLKDDVTVGGNADINLAGQAVNFADTVAYTRGGSFSAVADHGKIKLSGGSIVDISAVGEVGKGGKLQLKASEQTLELAGQIKATRGSARLDVAKFSDNADFATLMNDLKTAGISESIYFRSREVDINQAAGNIVEANAITLVSDKGAISLAGELHADGAEVDIKNNIEDGGSIKLYAGDNITLKDGAKLTATGSKDKDGNVLGQGGKVLLSSLDKDHDNNSGINIQSGSSIDVTGAKTETGGEVTLQALRTDADNNGQDDGVNIQPIAGTVQGIATGTVKNDVTGESRNYSKFYADGFKRYSNSDFSVAGEINRNDINKIKADTDAYMTAANMQKVNNTLGQGIHLRPGVMIDYTGDLKLNVADTLGEKGWVFADWHYSESANSVLLPGTLIINTNGNFDINSSISDGFKKDEILDFDGVIFAKRDYLQTGDSWSYQITAGSDVNSADTSATATAENSVEVKNLKIGPKVNIRTGTGDIELGASGDIVLADQTSTVYIVGKPEETGRYGTLTGQSEGSREYTVDGGDLVINAGRDIIGALIKPSISSWLTRQGLPADPDTGVPAEPTAWGIDFDYFENIDTPQPTRFQHNIGSFGGGKVNINAARDVNDLSVIVPSTGKQIGIDGKNEVQVLGGGSLQVDAGRNIAGGLYVLGHGDAEMSAGGKISGSTNTTVGGVKFVKGPHWVIGDTKLSLDAKNGVSINGVSDEGMLFSAALGKGVFYRYTDNSRVKLASLSGDIQINNDIVPLRGIESIPSASPQESLAKIYPGSLESTAFDGSIFLNDNVTLFPSTQGALSLLAGQDINSPRGLSNDTAVLRMSDGDLSLLPTATQPAKSANADLTILAGLIENKHAPVPVHINDAEPVRLVARNGDITSLTLFSPKKAIIKSGNDIINARIDIQHVKDTDMSVIDAGHDIDYPILRTNRGVIDGSNIIGGVTVGGPGDVLVKAGNNINLGLSNGLATSGNLFNNNLTSKTGANITVLAGLRTGSPGYVGFFDVLKYGKNFIDYKKLVVDFMRERTANPDLSETAALQAFRKLDSSEYVDIQPALAALLSNQYADKNTQLIGLIKDYLGNQSLSDADALKAFFSLNADEYLSIQPKLNALIDQVFFNELKETGISSAADPKLGNERGFAVIDTLFPGKEWKGDLNLYFSKIQTSVGGNIDLLVPGGGINVGLASSFTANKGPDQLGIIAQGQGHINAFLRDDFVVNQSRVFTLGGDEILVWSSEGDIDAGRGAKSAFSAPSPVTETDKDGNTKITIPAVVSGSGIRTIGTPDKKAGDVFLFAPKGVVNASEAGIAGNNVTISATAVLGANNIQVGGIGTGVPVSASGSIAASLSGVSNLSASVTQVAQASADMNDDHEKTSKNFKLGVLSIDILGYGDGTPSTTDDKKKQF